LSVRCSHRQHLKDNDDDHEVGRADEQERTKLDEIDEKNNTSKVMNIHIYKYSI